MPAHCGVPGNEEAGDLANEGRSDGPLYLLLCVSEGLPPSFVDDQDLGDPCNKIFCLCS